VTEDDDVPLYFSLLGPLRVERPASEVQVGGARRRSVLLRLLASPNRVVTVDTLAEDVWEGNPPAAAASTLQSHVSALRQLLGPGRLTFAHGGYCATVGPGELDSALFEADIAAARADIASGSLGASLSALERGLDRWRGSPFADVAGAEWALGPTVRLEEERNEAVEEALEVRLELGLHFEVCVLAEEAVTAEPFRERRWAALMLALYRAGRQADALRCYQRARQTLGEELGIGPSPQLARLENDILLQADGLAWQRPARTAPAPSELRDREEPRDARTNLPAPVSTFVGREQELAELDKLLGAHRLVSIVGTGGIGKTRLAIEAARQRVDLAPDGVWFIDLAAVPDPAGLASAVAAAIGVRSTSDEPLEDVLRQRVKDLGALSVFDNCEHLVGQVAAVVEGLLEAGPTLGVLATSRETLRVPGERAWHTPPVATPEHPEEMDAVSLAALDGVRLFVERASESTGGREVAVDELRLVGALTARLDGLPLAIELAAARAGALGLDELASLDDLLGVLGSGARTAQRRHQTLASTIDWSYQLLPAGLRAAFRHLAVFVGGFTLEAAEAVIPGPVDALEAVTLLVERSLLVRNRPAAVIPGHAVQSRYRMLETVRQFSLQRLRAEDGAAGEAGAREAHSSYFAELARRAAGPLAGRQQGKWLDALELERANTEAAIVHLLDGGWAAEAAQFIVHLDRFWHNRSHLAECANLIRRALESGPDMEVGLRCAALNLAAQVVIRRDAVAGAAYLSECLPLARDAGDDYRVAAALPTLAWADYVLDDGAAGLAAGREAVELARQVGDPVLLGSCLVGCGLNTMSDLDLCKSVYEEAITVTRRSGDRVHLAWSYNNLGNGLMAHGEMTAAREYFERALAIFAEIGVPDTIPLANLGFVCLQQGDLGAASAAFVQSVRGARRYHLAYESAYGWLGLACVSVAQQDHERAARLFGFADTELEACGQTWAEPDRSYREQGLGTVNRQLGWRADILYDSGRAADREEIAALVLPRSEPVGH
jgi:predicted ATPase/DNA-binding SARP family transcriptional activator